MKRIFRTYLINLKACQLISWEYRFSYFFRIFRIIVDFGVTFLIINIYFSMTSNIGNWTKSEVFLVYALFQIVSCLYNLFCGDSLDELSIEVRTGNLDKYLLKPMDSQLLISTKRVFPSVIYRIILSVILFIYAVNKLHLIVSIWQLSWLLILILSATAIYYSLIFLATVLCFWTFGDEMNDLMSSILSITKFPLDIFNSATNKILTILPIIFLVTVPAKFILGKNGSLHFIAPFVALLSLFIARKFWNFALHHYSSASS
jgi:ABC-2 type transport system permease protein